MSRSSSRLWLCTLVVLLTYSSLGGGLGDLKKKTDKKAEKKAKEKSSEPKSYGSYSASEDFGSGTFPSDTDQSSLLGGLWGWLVTSPFNYHSDDPAGHVSLDASEDGWADDAPEGKMGPWHDPGQLTMPYIRVDINQQVIDSDNEAIDGRIELGYKAIGFMARTTKYDDSLFDLTQRINQYYGMLRYGGQWRAFFPGSFEVALGLGVAHHKGDLSDDSAAAITIPLKYHPTDWLGFEFRPAWYEGDYGGIVYDIGDYDLSASLGYRYFQVRAGYRWLWFSSIDETLDGPYAGVSLSF